MRTLDSLFALFPDAISIAIASVYGVKLNENQYQLSKYIYIMPRRDEFDDLYHPRMDKYSRKPDYYFVAVSTDNRYYSMGSKKIEDADDVLGSITLAHQALCIFHSCPYALGQIHGFRKDSGASYGISNPSVTGRNIEFSDELFKRDYMFHPFSFTRSSQNRFNQDLVGFFVSVADAHINNREKKWLLSAKKFTSGINQTYAEDAILDFAVALESLLATDKEQISFKLRLYLALYVGDSFSERQSIYKDVKDFYGLRSRLVHGNTLSVTDEQIHMITRIGIAISRALVKSCGKKIQDEVLSELEFMSLLGAPRYIKEKTQTIITEEEIVELICKTDEISHYKSYKAHLSKDDPDDDYTELVITFTFEDENQITIPASYFISKSDSLQNISSFQHWLSMDDNGRYFYNVIYS
ncbi:HEPN domain-containing protein [Paenibacillus sp. R14(2021)]|uniref:HEPN domain-containing protein n=1 Tax=Paenibacillus sp. R14(2021) TaxID=2859228 RepID=UPI001C61519E|nr:HEPN domain-containing protein [Paenibacillus sp. R14(2021)]